MTPLVVTEWIHLEEKDRLSTHQMHYLFLQLQLRLLELYMSPLPRVVPIQLRIEEEYKDGWLTNGKLGRLVLQATNV